MRRHSLLLAAVLPLLASASGAQAQGRAGPPPAAGPGEIRGTVMDAESRSPLPSASVAVWSRADSSLVAGAIAGRDGSFRVQGLPAGAYYLKIASVGYRSLTSGELVVAAAAPRIAAGNLALERAPIELEAVEANAERTVVIAPDRTSYRARDVAPAATSATDVLETVPSVEVDADGKVSLRGNENVVVQINGRPTPIRGEQLAGYLKQLPANTIERVEVIPNPTAKQDPEGMAGILNIVLKQAVDLGRSGGITLSAATSGRYSGSGNFGYQGGPITLLTSYGYTTDAREVAGVNDRTRLGAERTPLSYTEQDIAAEADNRGHNVNASLDYRLSDKDALYTSLMVNRRRAADESLTGYDELNDKREVVDRYLRRRDVDNGSWLFDGALGYRRTITPQRHELSSELRFNRTSDRDRNAVWREDLGFPAVPVEIETNALDAVTRQLVAQADYTRPLGEHGKLETGYKGTWRWLDRELAVATDAAGTGEWEPSDLSNAFEFDEGVNALYAVVSRSSGAFQLQGGLRAEHARRDFALADGDRYPHDYTSLFPSALVGYQLNERDQAKLSYSRRIRRPGTWELNPFPNFMDVQNVFIGNPGLGAEYTHSIELALQRSAPWGSVQISPFYRHTTDIIRVSVNTADTVAGREVTSVSFNNLDTGTSWGADINSQLRIGQAFSGMAAVNLFRMVTDGGSTSSLSSDAISWTARVNATYNLNPATALQATYFYRAPTDFERGRFAAFSVANLTVRRKLAGDRASVAVRWSDPFRTSRFRVEAGDDNIIQLTSSRFNSRAVHVTFTYNMGQAPRPRPVRPEQEAAPPQTGFPPP